MKRVVEITTILISIDKILKSYFQFFFPNNKIEWNGWGVTYKKNYGTWLIPNATRGNIILLIIGCVVILFFAIYLYKYYTMNVRTGKLVDAIFSLLLAGISSNIFIDQALLGYIRDYIINPIAISNLSDIYVNLMVVLIVIESIILHRNKKNRKTEGERNSLKKYFLFIYSDIKKRIQ